LPGSTAGAVGGGVAARDAAGAPVVVAGLEIGSTAGGDRQHLDGCVAAPV